MNPQRDMPQSMPILCNCGLMKSGNAAAMMLRMKVFAPTPLAAYLRKVSVNKGKLLRKFCLAFSTYL